jgi:chaperonin GroEL
LSLLTGGNPFLKITGDSLERVSSKHFGHARRVWADARQFGIVGGGGRPIRLREHLQTLKKHHQRADDVVELKALQERIANLMNGSVTLWVGGFTKPEIDTRKRLAQRTALILRAAMQSGVVPGGGMALYRCRDLLEKRYRETIDVDERAVYRSLSEALAAPARTIYRNAGYDPGEVFAQFECQYPTEGFDVVANRVVDLCQAGIMDSLHVLQHCVSSAVRTAALALTIDSLVHLSAPEMVGKPQ